MPIPKRPTPVPTTLHTNQCTSWITYEMLNNTPNEPKIKISNNIELEEQLKNIKKIYNEIQFEENISKG